MKLTLLVFSVVLVAGQAAAQWSSPIPLPADSADDMMPVVIPVSDSGLFAAWVARSGSGQQIRGSMYGPGVGWNEAARFTSVSPEIAQAGPALTHDPGHSGLRVAYYNGSYPVDEEWGIWTLFCDSTGVRPAELAMADTGVEAMVMRYNDSEDIGLLWNDITGSGMEQYASVWFAMMSGDTWRPRQLVASGANGPVEIDCALPAMCRDTGNRFLAAYVTTTYGASPVYRVRVLTLPDTATLGEFLGTMPALVSDEHGTVMLAYTTTVNTDNLLLVRRYQSGFWSEPDTLTRAVTPNVRPRLCVDTEGLFWVVYSTGISSPPWWLEVRYFDGSWSSAEQVAPGGVTSYPVIISTYSAQVWIVWQERPGSYDVLMSAYRLSRPGVAERGPVAAARVGVSPSIGAEVFKLSLPRGGTASIFDAAGRRIRTLVAQSGGVVWDGCDEHGRRLSGVYCVRAEGGGAKLVVW